jgi:hypothetical protein
MVIASLHEFLKFLACSMHAHFCRRHAEIERLRNLLVRQLFLRPHQDGSAIHRIQRRKRQPRSIEFDPSLCPSVRSRTWIDLVCIDRPVAPLAADALQPQVSGDREQKCAHGFMTHAIARRPDADECLGRHVLGNCLVTGETEDEAMDSRGVRAVQSVEVEHDLSERYIPELLKGYGRGGPIQRAESRRARWRRWTIH